MKNKKLFKEFMVGMGEMFEKEISNILSNLYWKAIEPFTDEQCRGAFNKAITQCKFFPKIADLVELMGGGAGKLEDIAQVQADLVIKAIRHIGGYQSVDFRDPVTKAVIVSCFGGWIKMCEELKEVDEKWYRKDFVKFYQAYSRQNIKNTTHLSGLHETENYVLGYIEDTPDPVQIETALIEDIKQIEG